MANNGKVETVEEWKKRTGKTITKVDFSEAYDNFKYQNQYIRYKGEKNKIYKVNKQQEKDSK